MPAASTDPVLIAGAGPSGLVLALSLAKSGVPVRIIDKDSEFHAGQRGAGLQPRTLELYHFLGVLPDVINGGFYPMKRCIYEMPEGRKPLKIFDIIPWDEPTPSVPFSNSRAIGQALNEEILRSHLAKHNVFVELNSELVDFEQNESGVTAHIIRHDGSQEPPETIAAAFLVGADGARSTVRKKLGLTFSGETREEDRMLLAEMELRGLSGDYFHSWGEHETCIVYLRRTEQENVFSCTIFGRQVDFQSLFDDYQTLFKLIKEVTNRHDELEFGNILWISEWRPNIRMTNKLDVGRIFIAGDAGHVHSPLGAQGLNSGVQDSYNLAWKLSLAYKGLAGRFLLDSYTTERLPVIADMLGRTTAILDQSVKFKTTDQNMNPHVRPKILNQLGVNCRWSPIIADEQPEAEEASHAGAYLLADPTVLYAGDRAPDAPGLVDPYKHTPDGLMSLFNIFEPTRHVVLIFTNDVNEARPVLRVLDGYPRTRSAMVTVIILPIDVDVPPSAVSADFVLVDQEGHAQAAYPPVTKGFSVIIVRPDGVVGAVVKDAQGIKSYFDRFLTSEA